MKPVSPLVKLIAIALGLFVALVLVGPKHSYCAFLRGAANAFFSTFGNQRTAHFKPYPDPERILDTTLSIGTEQRGYLGNMNVNFKRQGYIPTILFLSLAVATPLPWRRRAVGLVSGLVLVQIFVLTAIAVALAQGFTVMTSEGRPLLALPGAMNWFLMRLDKLLSGDMNTTYLVPILIWVGLMVRMEQVRTWIAKPEPAGSSSPS